MNDGSPHPALAELGSRVRQLVDQVERERDQLQHTAEPLQRPIATIDHWQHVAHRVIPLIPAILAAAAGIVLLLWVSGRWSQDRVKKWMGFALEAYALWRSLQAAHVTSSHRNLLP
ncbi:MAG TPA: hypothetical protein VJM11_13100 [Nevskiaceae bacterium]|nr:hypothetical protein [Nevskiaceae bacterium]